MRVSDFSQYDPTLERAITGAVRRLEMTLDRQLPLSKSYLRNWLTYLSGTEDPADYYRHVPISPMFWFPWFLEKGLAQKPSLTLQADLVDSTVNGYYYIRLIDNLVDHHATVEMELLPALGIFHTQFQRPYQKYFDDAHPFWKFFTATWFHSADVTMKDTRCVQQDQAQFLEIAAQKICAIKIPLAAVAYFYNRPEQIEPWSQLVDDFGRWHQMNSDIFHWHEDLSHGVTTYFLSEARKQKSANESPADWVLREGFQWGLNILDLWMADVLEQARNLNNENLIHYLSFRRSSTRKSGQEVRTALQSASKLSSLLL
jgi:hypothetical protein